MVHCTAQNWHNHACRIIKVCTQAYYCDVNIHDIVVQEITNNKNNSVILLIFERRSCVH